MRKTILFLNSLLLLLLLGASPVFAQTEARLLLRWTGEGRVPGFFAGKRIAVANAPVSVSVAALSGTRVADLGKEQVLWYVNGELVREGVGLDRVRLLAPAVARSVFEVRAEIPSLGAAETAVIPVGTPEVVIEAPVFYNSFPGSGLILKAVPFFFSFTELEYSWKVNGRSPDQVGDPRRLQLNLADSAQPNTPVQVGVVVSDTFRQERSAGSRTLFYKP